MDDLPFYGHSNGFSVISGGWERDNECLCSIEPVYGSKDFRLQQVSNPGSETKNVRACERQKRQTNAPNRCITRAVRELGSSHDSVLSFT